MRPRPFASRSADRRNVIVKQSPQTDRNAGALGASANLGSFETAFKDRTSDFSWPFYNFSAY
jgi:hypothetical protein